MTTKTQGVPVDEYFNRPVAKFLMGGNYWYLSRLGHLLVVPVNVDGTVDSANAAFPEGASKAVQEAAVAFLTLVEKEQGEW